MFFNNFYIPEPGSVQLKKVNPFEKASDNRKAVFAAPFRVQEYRPDERLKSGVEGLVSLEPDPVFFLAFSPADVLFEPERGGKRRVRSRLTPRIFPCVSEPLSFVPFS